MNEAVFNESLITNRAEYLASRLRQALCLLFRNECTNTHINSHFAYLREHQEENKVIEIQLQRIFAIALNFKADSILCKNKFVWIVHEPGTSMPSLQASDSIDTQEDRTLPDSTRAEPRI
jgi:hypothetical protein